MIFENPTELRDRIESLAGRSVRGDIEVTDNTSDYMGISAGTVLRLEGCDYFVMGEAKEGRFGIGEQPKFWVKYVVDLSNGNRKVLKLVFHEQFTTNLGPFTVRCQRDPDKESRVLEIVKGDTRFMQGRTVRDAVGNNVRILDFIRGTSLYNYVQTLQQTHEEYFRETFPGILAKVVDCIDALRFLHESGEQHGDVRNDHILIESDTGKFRWIDFDYTVNYSDYDLWSVGNILTYTAGKGIRTWKDALVIQAGLPDPGEEINPDDALLFFKYRLANLRKIFPYIGESLNDRLMRFSTSTVEFYDDLADLTRDLRELTGRD